MVDRIAMRGRRPARSSIFSASKSYGCLAVEIPSSCSLFAVVTPSLRISRIELSSKYQYFHRGVNLDTQVELI